MNIILDMKAKNRGVFCHLHPSHTVVRDIHLPPGTLSPTGYIPKCNKKGP